MARKPRPPHKIGRKRRAAGWMLLVLGVIVAGVWVASGWWVLVVRRDGAECTFGYGEAMFATTPMDSSTVFRRHSPMWVWGYGFGSNYGARRLGLISIADDSLDVALWPVPPFLFATGLAIINRWAPATLLLRSGLLARRRAMTGACAKCGYSLAGLAKDAPCPECGKGAAGT